MDVDVQKLVVYNVDEIPSRHVTTGYAQELRKGLKDLPKNAYNLVIIDKNTKM